MPFVFYIFLTIVLTRISFAIRSIVLHRKNNMAVRSALAATPRPDKPSGQLSKSRNIFVDNRN